MLAGVVNKGFLFATSSRKIKNHVVESQITLLVWPCLNHLQKNIAQLITWSFLMIQSVSFTSAAFEAFAEAYLCFFSICLDRKNAEAIKFPGILKIKVSKNKIYFCLKKKSNVSLNKNVIFVFHTILKLDFITQINCFIHRCLYSLFILSLFLYQFHANGTMKVLTLPYSYNWQKFNNKINEKRSHAYQSMYPECVTGQINSRIVDLLLRQSCRLIHAPSWKS